MNFVIIASPRTGSTHLVTTLSGHPEIFCNGNIFKKSKIQLYWPKNDQPSEVIVELSALRDLDPDQFLKRVYSKSYGRKHVGFKIFNGQSNEMLLKLIARVDIKKIVLYRTNVLANYSSRLAARTTGAYSQGNVDQTQTKVHFARDQFIAFHRQYISFYKEILNGLNGCRQPFYFLHYEDLNDQTLVRGVCNFIGANPNIEISGDEQYRKLTKQNSANIMDRFSNPAEVNLFLRTNELLEWKYEGATKLIPLGATPQTAVDVEDV